MESPAHSALARRFPVEPPPVKPKRSFEYADSKLHIAKRSGQTAAMPDWPGNLVFLGSAQKKLMARGTAILTYHKIGTPPKRSRDPFLYTDSGKFDSQLAALNSLGSPAIRLGEVLSPTEVQAGKFVITFDDGFQNVFDSGLEVLSRHRTPAAQFIVSGFIGKQNAWDIAKGDSPELLMDEVQIKEWLAAGHEIGSHSMTHRNLKTLSDAELKEEIIGSRKFLEDKFGVPIRHFCYPFGGWTPQARDCVIEAGYQTACGVEFGVNGPGCDLFNLRRIIPLSRPDLLRKILHRLARRIGISR